MTACVRTSFDGGVARIELARPEVRNAISLVMIGELRAAIGAVAERAASSPESVRVTILQGEGSVFCAGMDLKAVANDPVAMGQMLRDLSRALLELRRLPMPTIARVQGAAVGGGCGLAVVCDFAVTHAEAKLGYPEVDLGVCPAVVAPWLMRRIGAGPARAMLLMGGTITGREALARGLVTHCVEAAELPAQVASLAASLASGGRLALECTKRLLNELDGSLDERIADEAAELSARVIAGTEAQARISARIGSKPPARSH